MADATSKLPARRAKGTAAATGAAAPFTWYATAALKSAPELTTAPVRPMESARVCSPRCLCFLSLGAKALARRTEPERPSGTLSRRIVAPGESEILRSTKSSVFLELRGCTVKVTTATPVVASRGAAVGALVACDTRTVYITRTALSSNSVNGHAGAAGLVAATAASFGFAASAAVASSLPAAPLSRLFLSFCRNGPSGEGRAQQGTLTHDNKQVAEDGAGGGLSHLGLLGLLVLLVSSWRSHA